MSDIDALEARITAALDRIRIGVEQTRPEAVSADDASLQLQLEEERTANAQLVARVEALSARQDGRVADLETRVADQTDQMADLDGALQKLRSSNADLREVNAQLRAAAADGVASAELINRAMMAEIDALQAQRSADRAEMEAILGALGPLIGEDEHAAG